MPVAARRTNSSSRSGSHAKGSGRPCSSSPPGAGATVGTPPGVRSPSPAIPRIPTAVSSTAASTMAMRSRARCGPERSAGGTPLRLAHPRCAPPGQSSSPWRPPPPERSTEEATQRPFERRTVASIRVMPLRSEPKPAMRSKRVAARDLDADRAALGVVQAERAVVAVDGHDGALELRRGGGRGSGERDGGDGGEQCDELHGSVLLRPWGVCSTMRSGRGKAREADG